MWIVFECPSCRNSNLSEVVAPTEQLRCSSCSWQRPVSAENRSAAEPASCLACGCEDLWRQKDFPQRLGVLILGVEVILATYFWARMEPIKTYGVLLLFALLDGALYTLMRDVLVCYRCQARHRHAPLDGRHERFNLETHERYRQEAIRLEAAENSKLETRSSKSES